MQNKITHEFSLNGVAFKLETGEMANHAQSSFLVQYGETSVLITIAVGSANPELDFFPLTVDYVEKLYAGGMISSSPYIKREGRPTDKEILNARLIDHAIRSLFPGTFRNETQVIAQVFSYDKEHDPVMATIIGVSFALSYSGLPFLGPYGATRVAYIEGKLAYNPTLSELHKSELEMIVSSVDAGIVSVEADAHDLPDEVIKEGITQALELNKTLIEEQNKFVETYGKKPFEWQEITDADDFQKLFDEISDAYKAELTDAIYQVNKMTRESRMKAIQLAINEKYADKVEAGEVKATDLNRAFEKLAKKIVRTHIIEESKRADGRKLDEIRPISMRVGVLPRVHGSALFNRGETQTLTIVTLGTERDALQLQDLTGEHSKNYFHHYNMPGYANGEVDRKLGFPNRRAIGHGMIGEKALVHMIPPKEEFPYTLRVVSEVLSSNGSTSMAATCSSSLALMDAGVPVKRTVGGIGIGLVYNSKDEYTILTDIIGLEDFYGDMDFKITGSKEGITAIQLDNKMAGIPKDILFEAIDRSKQGRLHVIDLMEAVIPESRKELSVFAPKVQILRIDPDKIGELIGPGGKVIKGIVEKTGAEINIEDDGTVMIYSSDDKGFQDALALVNGIVKDLVVGEEYDTEVVRIESYGAFVEVPNTKIQGMVHVSNLGLGFVKDINTVLKLGQTLKVKYLGKDEKGRVKFAGIGNGEQPESGERPARTERPERTERPQGTDRTRRAPRPRENKTDERPR